MTTIATNIYKRIANYKQSPQAESFIVPTELPWSRDGCIIRCHVLFINKQANTN